MAFLKSATEFILVFVIMVGVLIARTRSSSECSVVKTSQDQQCVYNIHITQDSGRHCRTARHRRRQPRDIQNDYVDKIDSMEKTFSFLKDEHENRLKDLEGTMRDLLGTDSASLPTLTKPSSGGLAATGSKPSNQFVDDSVLARLHDELGKLRKALRDKTDAMFALELRASEKEQMLEKIQENLLQVNQDLIESQNTVTVLQRERAVLKNKLKDRSYNLEVSSGRLAECEDKSKEQQDQLMALIRSENTLSEAVLTCQQMVNKTKAELDMSETRHQQLKSLHSRVTQVLGIRERELIDCYAAKTQSFCGFEDRNMCGFTQPNDTSDFFDWDRAKGRTPSRRTGPSADHTCRSSQGHFMYIEASAKGRKKNAIIYSPLYRGMERQCLEFYYHMFGRHIGTLNVYAKARGRELASVWRAYGNQGDLWSVARLAIPKRLARAGYQIAFEGITENGFEGDIAIDDVSVTDGNCAVDDRVQTVVVDIDTSSIVPDIDDQLPDLEINQGRRRPDLNQRRRRPDSVDRRRRPDLEDRRRRLQLARIGRRRN